jgi:hypothetical protein
MTMKNQNKPPRKSYSKPLIAVEDFTFNQFIASCAIKTGRPGKVNANWQNELKNYNFLVYTQVIATGQFIDGLCEVHADADYRKENMDSLCYHTSTSPLLTS